MVAADTGVPRSSSTPTATSCSSPSTRCAPTRWLVRRPRARRRTSIGWPRTARASTSRTRTPSSRCHRTPPSSPAAIPYEHGIRDNTGYRLGPVSRRRRRCSRRGALPPARSSAAFRSITVRPERRVRSSTTTGSTRRPATRPRERERRADAVVAAALDWIGGQPGKWFAWVHVYDPHAPTGRRRNGRRGSPPTRISARCRGLTPRWRRCSIGWRRSRGRRSSSSRRSRRESRRARRADPRPLRLRTALRVPLIVAELGPPARRAPAGRSPRRSATSSRCRRCSTPPRRRRCPLCRAPSLRAVDRVGRGADRPSYFEAMTATVTRGWAPLRGVVVAATSSSTCRSPSSTTWRPIRAKRRTSPAPTRRERRCC